MTDHLGDDELRAYARGALNGAALLAADDHLVSCRACEQRLQELPNGAAAALLRHLDDAVIENLASGTLTEDDEAAVELHTSVCARCRERWAFLRADEQAGEVHRGTLVPFPRRASRAPLAAAIAATLVLLCGLGIVLVARRPATVRGKVATVTHTPTAAAPRATAVDARPLPVPAPIAPDAPRTTVLLRDAHGAITTSGTTTAGIPPGSWRTAVEA
ncbi:MAG TPA: hypothetical protein VE010_06390, partial [Thermoanaerobaculia bacterium]|nr:hypothetical protein [Thermoanaerobaculia bacterium]